MRKLFKWSDKYSVGVPSLDIQHKRFFEITNEIVSVLDNPNYSNTVDFANANVSDLKKQLILLIVELGNYALGHLGYEEGCLRTHKCPGCETHTEIHDVYREKVKNYLGEVRKPEIDVFALAQDVATFSQDWLSQHILSKDKEYTGCLTKFNVQ